MFVDSVFWIAIKYERDQWHDQAKNLKETLLSIPDLYITDFIIVETYNFLLRKVSIEVAKETLITFLTSPKIHIFYNDDLSLKSTVPILEKFPNLSVTDANIIWYCKVLGNNKIISFDKGFDSVNDIIRIK